MKSGRARIRARRTADLAPLVDALALVAAADDYPSRWPVDPISWLRGKDLLGAWVADWNGDLVGQVVLRRPHGEVPVMLWCAATGQDARNCAVVVRLFVVPQARGRGLGSALVGAACAAAMSRGIHAVLDVVDTNQAAVRLYERLGWTRLGSYEETFNDGGPAELLHCFAAP